MWLPFRLRWLPFQSAPTGIPTLYMRRALQGLSENATNKMRHKTMPSFRVLAPLHRPQDETGNYHWKSTSNAFEMAERCLIR
jgi:hypothetical protein